MCRPLVPLGPGRNYVKNGAFVASVALISNLFAKKILKTQNHYDIALALIQPIILRNAELCSRCANLQNYTCDACWTFNCGN